MGGGSSKTTVNYLISLIDRVHKIYEDTIWTDKVDGQGFSGMGFIIKKIVGMFSNNMSKVTSFDYRDFQQKFQRPNLE